MKTVICYITATNVDMDTGPDICEITVELNRLVKESSIKDGSLFATLIGSTGSLTTIEFEPGVVEDLKRAVNELAPPERQYAHEMTWHDGNGHSHVQAALMGPSIVLPVRDGSLRLGAWQQVVAINHDNRPRTRTIEVTLTGTI